MFDTPRTQPRETFETLLERLDEQGLSAGKGAKGGKGCVGAMTGAERLWPRANAAPAAQNYLQGDQLERLYEIERMFAEAQPEAAAEKSPQPPQRPMESRSPSDLIELIGRASGSLSLEELRSLRRQCALALHPDRVATAERERAQQWMAEANAAIDRAMARFVRAR